MPHVFPFNLVLNLNFSKPFTNAKNSNTERLARWVQKIFHHFYQIQVFQHCTNSASFESVRFCNSLVDFPLLEKVYFGTSFHWTLFRGFSLCFGPYIFLGLCSKNQGNINSLHQPSTTWNKCTTSTSKRMNVLLLLHIILTSGQNEATQQE